MLQRILKIGLALLVLGTSSLAYAQDGPPVQFNQKTLSCVKEIAGVDDITELDSNKLTDAQMDELDEKCFKSQQKTGDDQPNNQPAPKNVKWAKPTEDCLIPIFGSLEAVNAAFAKQYTKEEGRVFRRTVDKCLGKNAGIGKPEGLDEFKTCVTTAVGEAEAKKMFESFTPPAPGSELSKKVQAAGCGKKMQHQFNGARQEMPKEMKECFIKNNFNPDTQVIEDIGGEEGMQKIQLACNLGPDGPNGGPEAKLMMECLKEKGIDPKQASRGAGAGVVSKTETDAFEECGKKFGGFRPGGQGGPGGPQLSDEVAKCFKENKIPLGGPDQKPQSKAASFVALITGMGTVYAQEPPRPGQPGTQPQGGPQGPGPAGAPELNETQRQAAQKCFGGPGGPNGPQGQGDEKRKQCEDKVGFKPEPGKPMAQDKADALRTCFEEMGFGNFGPGPGQPQNGPQGEQKCDPNNQPGRPEVKGTTRNRLLAQIFPGQRPPEGQQPPQGDPNGQRCGPPPQGGPNGPQNGQPGPNGQQPGQPNNFQNQPPQGGPGQPGGLPPQVRECAKTNGFNVEGELTKEIREQILQKCPNNAPQGNQNPPGERRDGPGNPPPGGNPPPQGNFQPPPGGNPPPDGNLPPPVNQPKQ